MQQQHSLITLKPDVEYRDEDQIANMTKYDHLVYKIYKERSQEEMKGSGATGGTPLKIHTEIAAAIVKNPRGAITPNELASIVAKTKHQGVIARDDAPIISLDDVPSRAIRPLDSRRCETSCENDENEDIPSKKRKSTNWNVLLNPKKPKSTRELKHDVEDLTLLEELNQTANDYEMLVDMIMERIEPLFTHINENIAQLKGFIECLHTVNK